MPDPDESPTVIEPRAVRPGPEPPTVVPGVSLSKDVASDPAPPAPQPEPPTAVPGVSLSKDVASDPAPPAPSGGIPAQPDPYAATQSVPTAYGPGPAMPQPGQSPYPGMAPTSGPPGPTPPGYPTAGYPAQGYPPGGYPPPGYPPGAPQSGWQPPQPRRSNTKAYAITGIALACVLALVIGGVVWWKTSRSPDDPELVAGQLTGSFPTTPSAAWRIDSASVGGEAFVSVLSQESQYRTSGAAHDDDTLVTLVSGPGTADGPTRRVLGVDVETGGRWIFDKPVTSCSPSIVDHTIACLGDATAYFIDTRTGQQTGAAPAPASAFGIAYNGKAAYVRTFGGGAGRSVTFQKITPSGTEWERVVELPEALPTGDSSQFIATEHFVASADGVVAVVSADDGREVLARPGRTGMDALSDGSLLVTTGRMVGDMPENGPLVRIRPDGTTDEIAGATASAPVVATPGQEGRVLIDTAYTDLADGDRLWSMQGLQQYSSPELAVADDREVVVRDNGKIISVDTRTGQERWTSPAGRAYGSTSHSVTDGERLITPTAEGGLVALDLEGGAAAWTLPAASLGNVPPAGDSTPRAALTFALGDRLVTLTSTAITGFAPTGPRAIVPGTERRSATGDGGTTYVTPCGSPPVFEPQSFRTASGGLVVTFKVTAKCPGGDVLYGPQTRITISDGSGLIASGNFDFQRSPVAVPSLDDAGSGLTLELTYPPGSFFRLPDTLPDGTSAGPGTAGAGSTGSNAGGGRYLVDCDKGPTSGAPPSLTVPESGTSSASAVATGPALPAGADVTASSANALRLQADSDRAFILANLNNRWVAQLSSKRPGLVADGRTWDDQAILDEFLALRLRFNDVRLLYSDEWPIFSYSGWWVTVAAATFPGPAEANNWCRAQGFDPDHCFAKLIRTTGGPEGTTVYWK
ncbi:outer membrane protein assembly factor BamB family protein [Gordonia paraffinivorans]|uniref:outer membrane protein assembly factor BamB family protein n=1 Tax=Gordonia paraffinivorans TaxID=175628 RepID=UPI00289A27E4|nr:PQQ-binding-like beta-propeller repeat protein [Gordonia paraffinivorans]